jgi:alkylation response protein AidB-like acyl-CoA dehydrogenase
MATTDTKTSAATPGGGFLIEDSKPEDVFIPEEFSEEQIAFGQTTQEFVENEVVPHIEDLEHKKEDLMPSLLRKAGELGLLGVAVPEAYGGMGLDKISSTLITEKVSIYGGFSATYGGHNGIGTLPIVYFGTEEQKKKYLPKITSGEWISCYALSEAEAGSDALAGKATAKLTDDGKHYVLDGQKAWITNGGFADVFIVFAKVDGEKFSCFIVDKDTPGFTIGAEEQKMGIKGSSTVPLFFDNAKIPAENLLHEVGRGHIVAFNILNQGRFTLAAGCLGGGKRAITEAVNYAKERKAFGKSISEFGLISHKLAEMAILTYASESMIYRTAGLIDSALSGTTDDMGQVMKALEEYAIESSINKVYCSEILDYIVDEFVQILGGYGYHEEYPAALAYRDSRINRIFEGTNEINRMLIVDMLFKRAMKGQIPLLPAAKKVAEELMTATPSMSAPSTEVLAAEEALVTAGKKAFLFAAGVAAQKYMTKLGEEQEIVGALSDVVMDAFAAESALLRAKKLHAAGNGKAEMAVTMTQVFVRDALDRIEVNARTALAACEEGDMLRTQLAMLRRLLKRDPVNSVALRRRVSDAVIEQSRYPLS